MIMHVISYRHCGDSANLAVRRASCRFPVGHDAENMPSRSSVSCVGGPGSSTDGRKRRLRRHTPSDARERTDNYSRSNPEPDPTSSPETYSRRPARRRTLRERERGDGAAETVIVMALLALIVLGLIQYAAPYLLRPNGLRPTGAWPSGRPAEALPPTILIT